MLTPLALLEMPDAQSGQAPRHVGLTSLLHDSGNIRKNWRAFVEKEKALLEQELRKDLPKFLIKQMPQETLPPEDEQAKDLARGVVGLPLDQTPALLGAERGKIDLCDVDVNDLVYWNHPQGLRDRQFVTPYAADHKDGEKFMSFQVDMGGWNNVRMSLEVIIVVAAATGRTLVLPPEQPFYLLSGKKKGNKRSFLEMFDLHDRDFAKQLKIMTMPDFLQQHGKDILGLDDDQMKEATPLGDECIHQRIDPKDCGHLFKHFEDAGFQPPAESMKHCVVFDEDYLHGRDIPADVQKRVQRFCGDERTPYYYSTEWQQQDLVHWKSEDFQYRLLNHFYSFVYFTNPVHDNFYKRLVRDYLHYKDDLYCAAGKIVHALQKEFGTFSTYHVRRGDFQYKVTRLSMEEWYNNTKEVMKPGEAIYIATDDSNRTVYEPLTRDFGHPVRFLDDYPEALGDLNSMYYGMVDTIIAAQGRVFIGTWFSTFTGYINRLRGYSGKAMKNSWYSWLPRKDKMQQWAYPSGNYPAREWPVAWTGIDADTWIEHETKEEVDNGSNGAGGAEEKEAGLDETGDGKNDDEEEEDDEDANGGKPLPRTVPTITLADLDTDEGFVDKPVARGLAGRPLSETPAVQGAKRGHIECDVNVDSLAYWNQPQGDRDRSFQSPFRTTSTETKYISFAPDRGGWNNIRMSMEVIFIFALATGRTLVLPPDTKLYLLAKGDGDLHKGFADFFPLYTNEFKRLVPIISMEEFVKREGGVSGAAPLPEDKKNATVVEKAAKYCDNREKSNRSCMVIHRWLEQRGYHPTFRAQDGCVVFDENAFKGSTPTAEATASASRFCGERNVTYITEEYQEPRLIHFHANDRRYRLLSNFYSFFHFTDPATENYIRRFVRDFLHYHDSIYCAAGKIVKALQAEGKKRGFPVDEEGSGGYSALHIRRGDCQFKKVKFSAKTWLNNTKEVWKPNELLYIATDVRDKTFFNAIVKHYDVRYLDDYWDFAGLGDLDPNYMGMIDTIVSSRARAFAGTWFSTFSGYINRMRGYHGMSMKDSWYSFLPRKTALHEWVDVDHYVYTYEWPTGWIGIDADTVPSKDKF